MENRGYCPACKCEHSIPAETSGKIAGAALGGAIGKAVHRSAWAPLVGVITGIVAGEIVDRTITPRCPSCRAVLDLIGKSVT